MTREDDRLFIVCPKCGDTDSMSPQEWRAGGDAHHTLWSHSIRCDWRPVVAVIRFDEINALYDEPTPEARAAFLRREGKRPVEVADV
jgi:hypothetical protein